jgi:acetyl-CoA carboxylase carboxyltransferase component
MRIFVMDFGLSEELVMLQEGSARRSFWPTSRSTPRLVDNSEYMEFRPGYGPEVYMGLERPV